MAKIRDMFVLLEVIQDAVLNSYGKSQLKKIRKITK